MAILGCSSGQTLTPPSTPAVAPGEWPGPAEVEVADGGGLFGSNLSGLHYQVTPAPSHPGGIAASGSPTGTLWAVRNDPSSLFRLRWVDGAWGSVTDDGWIGGKTLRYPDGSGVPDAEGVTLADAGDVRGVYVVTERDNDAGSTSRNSILRFDPESPDPELRATHEWNLTSILPPTDPNRGVEAITWIPDGFLVKNRFIDGTTGQPYAPPVRGPNGGGLFLIGVEATGMLHLFHLDHASGSATAVGQVSSTLPAIMGLSFDEGTGEVWAACDRVCGGLTAVFRIGPDGRFALDRVYRHPEGLPDLNNEGIAIAPISECRSGLRPFFWTDDDDTDGHAIRMGWVRCP